MLTKISHVSTSLNNTNSSEVISQVKILGRASNTSSDSSASIDSSESDKPRYFLNRYIYLVVGVPIETWGVSLGWGKVNNLVKRFVCGTGGIRKLCTVFYHSYIYGPWSSK